MVGRARRYFVMGPFRAVLGAAAAAWIAAAPLVSAPPASAAATPAASVRQIRFEGTLYFEVHGPRPGYILPSRSIQEYSSDGKGRTRLDWATWGEGDTIRRTPEVFLVAGDSLFHRSPSDSVWKLYTGERARVGRAQALAGFQTRPRIERRAHQRFGDVRDSVIPSFTKGDPVPTGLVQKLHERDAQWRLVESRTSWSADAPAESLFRSPARFELARPEPLPSKEVPAIDSLAPGVWSAELPDIDSRALIVEFADHLAVLEIAVGSWNGERIVDAARRRWPAKPIRYASFSHHHPHYLGGIRALMAEGATIVTTPGNEGYLRRIATYPFTIEPDRFARHPRPVHIETFTDRFAHADSMNELVALNYGARSNHTDEFTIFWLPRARMIFESEQGWVRVANGTTRASRRAETFLGWIAEQKLDVARIVQCWPMSDNDREQSLEGLQRLVAARKK